MSQPAFDGHEFVMALHDKRSGLKAFVAVHNTNLGPALGGTRMLAYKNDQAAIEDALNLSRAMSYKCALANLPYGGGKAVIVAAPNANREEILASYAKLIDKLRGLFKTGTDVGIMDGDVAMMAAHTSHMLGVTPADRGDLTTAKTAALGVFYAMKAALRHLYGDSSFIGRHVTIKGVGKLGGELARLSAEAGAQVVVADVSASACEELKERIPSIEIVQAKDIARRPTTIYAPCALGGEFTENNISELRCEAIVGGANNQLATSSVGEMLHERGIWYAPDYIANAGGLIYVADELEPGGFSKERVLERTSMIETTIHSIFEQSKSDKLSPSRIADRLAEARMGLTPDD